MRRNEAYYETAQVCLNGHMITSGIESSPEMAQKYCSDCGAPTITRCPACDAPIRGYHHIPGVISISQTKVRSYCHECGAPYPWTKAKLEAATELVQMSNLSEEEKNALVADLPALSSDTPRTKVAVVKWKRFLDNTTSTIKQALRDILVDIASETAKKALFG